jgi:hypothetical protein
MSPDDHRAPTRLAPQRPDPAWGRTSVRRTPPPISARPARMPEVADYRVPDYVVEEVEEEDYDDRSAVDAPPAHVTYAGGHDTYDYAADSTYEAPAAERESPPAYHNPDPGYRSYAPRADRSDIGHHVGALSMVERQQLLMHTVRLYNDQWKLAGIRSNPKNNWLIAYLTPKNRRLGLKEAISKNKVLIITIDIRGNTDINEPEKRGFFRTLTAWITGD